ncbi:MAG: helix-turn-helix domain-containing protein [Campylobacter sp.]|nr:helix-turn-helix domain-containing protein [Campylobacter sp.]
MLSYDEFKKKALERKDVKKAYDDLEVEFELKRKMIKLRKSANLTQDELAIKMNTTKSAISRLESLNSKTMPSYQTLVNYANALGKKIEINFV